MAHAAASVSSASQVAGSDGRVELAVNVAANAVSPSYDFSNAAPRLISFRLGGLLTGVTAVAMQPWRLLANPHIYIFVWLEFYGGLPGAVAGVLVAGDWMINWSHLDVAALYQAGGRYWFAAGWNWRGAAATMIGTVLAVGGAWSAPGRTFSQPGLDTGPQAAVRLQLGRRLRRGPGVVPGAVPGFPDERRRRPCQRASGPRWSSSSGRVTRIR